jgi:hypothetical protein
MPYLSVIRRRTVALRAALALIISLASCFLRAQSVNLTSSNLPIIVINTNGQEIQDDPKIVADMGIIYNGASQRNNITDPFNHYNGKIGIEIRGQSSQMFPQKSYSIELRKSNGTSSQDLSMFGLPAESDWVLYAPYTDKTLMRNFLAYTMSRELGHWASNCRFVEVIVNNDYRGVYVFMERIKRNSGRVNITKMAKTDISGDAVTGGYIFSLDKEPNGWFSSIKPPNAQNNNTRQFSYVVPKAEDIVPEQKAYLKRYVDSFELALQGPDYQDPEKGVRRFADMGSFMDYFIVNEISRNVDGYRLSTYLYKDRNSRSRKIVAGPVWDYDLAFRNANYCDGSLTTGWAYQFNYVCPGDGAGLIPFWWNRLMTDSAFTGGLRCRWESARQYNLSQARVNSLIDSVADLLREAQPRHHSRWPILGQYVWPNPNPIPTTYAGEISMLKDWIRNRAEWIDANLPNVGACAEWSPDKPGTMAMEVYPNPFRGNGQLLVQSKLIQQATLEVVDMAGHRIATRVVNLTAGNNNVPLDGARWAAGIYMIRLTNRSGEKLTTKLLKQ